MNLYTELVARVLFPAHEALKGHTTVGLLRQLERTQWLHARELHYLQVTRLRDFLQYVGTAVPYYRELFRRLRFAPHEVTRLTDLARLPLLSKADIRANVDTMKAENGSRLTRGNTGGSTGEPLIFYLGPERVSHDVAAKWRATRWWGVNIGDRELVVWGSPLELNAQDRLRACRDALMRTELLPAFEMSEEKLDLFVQRIRSRRPTMLFGYPSALAHIARYAERRGAGLSELGIRVAFVTSEKLYDDQKRDLERVFGCRVANGYGGRDAGFIAHECPAGGMHISAEDIIVEAVDDAGHPVPAGCAGELAVTHLATRDFPFIRYRTGDVGTLSADQCPCGRTLPLLKDIQGRVTDFVVAQDGTVMHGLALIYIIRDIPAVREFKVVQESLQCTRVLLVTEQAFAPTSIEKIRHDIRRRLGAEVDVRIERVRHIPRDASGKYRYVVSHVQTGFASTAAA